MTQPQTFTQLLLSILHRLNLWSFFRSQGGQVYFLSPKPTKGQSSCSPTCPDTTSRPLWCSHPRHSSRGVPLCLAFAPPTPTNGPYTLIATGRLPQFPKCPWEQGRFVVVVRPKTGHPSSVCAHMCVCGVWGGGSQSAVSVNVYLHTALVTSVLKSPQLLYYEVPALSFLCTLSDVANSIADGLKDLDYPKSLLMDLRQMDLNLESFCSWLNVFVLFFFNNLLI